MPRHRPPQSRQPKRHEPPHAARTGRAAPALSRPAAFALVAAGLSVITFAAFAGALGHGFLNWDDPAYVRGNALVLGKHYATLLRAVVSSNYHPLTMLSLAWNVSAPLSPAPFIATNVALHALNTVLVFWLALLLSGRRVLVAAVVALWFGIHPMHVESVAWISARKDVLSACFFLSGLIAYWSYLERRTGGLLGATFVLFVLACLSKAMAVSFPLVMALLDYWHGRPPWEARALREKLPFFAAAALFGVIAVDVQAGGSFHGLLVPAGSSGGALGVSTPLTLLQRIVSPAYAYMMYLWRFMVPVHLSALYPYPSAEASRQLPFLLAPIVVLATLALAARDAKRTRLITFGVGWFLATVVLVLQWLPVGRAIMADRYTYLPYVGLSFALVMGLPPALERRRPLGVALACAIAAFSVFLFVRTVRQVDTWQDSETLWTRAIAVDPSSSAAYVNRGRARGEAGRIDAAAVDLNAAFALGDRSAEMYDALGGIAVLRGEVGSALTLFDRSLALAPRRPAPHYNRGVALLRASRPHEALADFDRARTLGYANLAALSRMEGLAHMQLGEVDAAAADFERALSANPRDAESYYCRGVCRDEQGDRAGAVADLREALRIEPGHAAARTRLAALETPAPGSR